MSTIATRGTFRLTAEALAELVLPVGHSGLPLGRGTKGRWSGADVVLDVFRPRPTTVASFVGVGTTAVLARRLQRSGATVLVASREPGWQALLRLSRIDPRPVQALEGSDPPPVASFHKPVATIGAGRALVGVAEPDSVGRPWSLSIVMLPSIDLRATTQAREADIVLIGRRERSEADTLARVLELRGDAAAWITELDDDQVVVAVGRTVTVVTLGASVEELRLRAASTGWQRTRARRGRPRAADSRG